MLAHQPRLGRAGDAQQRTPAAGQRDRHAGQIGSLLHPHPIPPQLQHHVAGPELDRGEDQAGRVQPAGQLSQGLTLRVRGEQGGEQLVQLEAGEARAIPGETDAPADRLERQIGGSSGHGRSHQAQHVVAGVGQLELGQRGLRPRKIEGEPPARVIPALVAQRLENVLHTEVNSPSGPNAFRMQEYDQLAGAYRRSKEMPFRTHLETPLFLKMVGDVRGQAALDLACGEGHYTRLLASLGASPVEGQDISPGMIEAARKLEEEHPLGIRYSVSDARSLGSGSFGVVTAAYLLSYADSRDALRQMLQVIHDNLQPGGRFAVLHGMLHEAVGVDLSSYGVRAELATMPLDGAPYPFFLWDGSRWFELHNHAWRPETVLAVAGEVGLTHLEVVDATGTPELPLPPARIFTGICGRR